MALIRVAQYNSTPTVVEDYQAQNAHLQAFTNQLMTQQFILDSGTAQPVIKQGCYVSHGGSLYVADADTAITGSPSDGSVYIRVSGTTSLTVEFVTDISGYTWNPVYTALTSGSYTLLPYLIVKASTVWARYNFNPNNHQFGAVKCESLAVTGAITGASINTGDGDFEIGQNLRTTDSPTFAAINTGYGANEVFKISKETLAFGTVGGSGPDTVTKQISAMDIDEIRFVNTTGTMASSTENDYRATLKAPAGGTYLIIGSDFYSGIGYTIAGGTTIWDVEESSSDSQNLNTALIIRKLTS